MVEKPWLTNFGYHEVLVCLSNCLTHEFYQEIAQLSLGQFLTVEDEKAGWVQISNPAGNITKA